MFDFERIYRNKFAAYIDGLVGGIALAYFWFKLRKR